MSGSESTRKVVVQAYGGPEALKVEGVQERLIPGAGELLVQVEAAGVNYLDVSQRQGQGGLPLPFTPGLEGVGRIRAVGTGVERLSAGQRVAWIDVRGSYADRLVVPAAKVVVVPDALQVQQGLIFQALTAQYLVSEYRQVKPGDRVLVHSAAGGVGGLLVQWLKHLGAWVVGTVSSSAKAERVRAAGADEVIDYGHDYQFLDELRRLTGGQGVDLAFDAVGQATLPNTLQALARGGTAVSYGGASGPAAPVAPSSLIVKGLRLAGGSVFSYTAEPAELQRRAAEVFSALDAGWLRLDDGAAFPLDRAADAHRAIEGRGTQGKLYLTP